MQNIVADLEVNLEELEEFYSVDAKRLMILEPRTSSLVGIALSSPIRSRVIRLCLRREGTEEDRA